MCQWHFYIAFTLGFSSYSMAYCASRFSSVIVKNCRQSERQPNYSVLRAWCQRNDWHGLAMATDWNWLHAAMRARALKYCSTIGHRSGLDRYLSFIRVKKNERESEFITVTVLYVYIWHERPVNECRWEKWGINELFRVGNSTNDSYTCPGYTFVRRFS